MPDMSGQELARRAVSIQPDLEIIFASGNQSADDDKLPFDWSALRKPYTLAPLRDALRLTGNSENEKLAGRQFPTRSGFTGH
jgi:CheY-like chemotaxis protein